MGIGSYIKRLFDKGENQIKKENLVKEIYSHAGFYGRDMGDWFGMLPDPDPILRKKGEGISILRDLLADDKVTSCIQTRKLGTLLKAEYQYLAGKQPEKEPLPNAQRLRDDLAADIERINIYNLFSQLLDAPCFGYIPVEIIWRPEGNKLRVHDLKPRPPEWFGWSVEGDPLYIGTMTEEPVSQYKVVFARHFPDSSNPYGLRLLSRCLWPVAIKRGGLQFWANLCERFGTPWTVGKARPGADVNERNEMAAELATMVQNAVAVVAGESEIQVIPPANAGGVHKELIKYCDDSIARVLMGQTLTAEIGDVGSYAASKTHEDTLNSYQESDETLVKTFMNDLAWIYGQVNDQSALTPVFEFTEIENQKEVAELGKILYEQGVRFKKEFYIKKYGFADEDFDIAESQPVNMPPQTGDKEQGPNKENKKDKAEFAAPGNFTPNQQALEDLVGEVLPDAQKALAETTKKILEAIEAAENYEDLQALLAEVLADEASAEQLQEIMARVMMAGYKWGEYTVDGR